MVDENRIKISFIISGSEIGGTEKMLLLMTESITPERFYPPTVFAIKGSGKFTEELEHKKIKTYVFNLKKNPLEFIRLLRTVKKESPDILHSFLFYGNLTGRIIGRLLKIKVVISSQRSTDPWRKKYHWFIDRVTARWTDIIISNSHAGKKALTENAGISGEKIIVIPNGIRMDKSGFTYSRKDFGIEPSEYLVGTVGNLRSPKGHTYLISAAPAILKDFPETRFVIVGQGELRQTLVNETRKAGIEDRFIFTGFINNAADIIDLFDIFVFPSLWEGCPVSLLEAMGKGKPCVAFSVGDIPHIIEDGVSGLLIPVKNHTKLAGAIISLLRDREQRYNMGENARKRVKEIFSLEIMMKKYIAVYTETVDFKRERR